MTLNSKIDEMSNYIVNEYIEKGAPLSETISKVAQAERFNSNHIARLVESSNKKAFLRLFPEKHSFDVASVHDVEALLNRKTANHKQADRTGPDMSDKTINYKLLDVCKDDKTSSVKEASQTRHIPKGVSASELLASRTKMAGEELSFAARQKRSEMLECEDRLVDLTKQAMLRGVKFSELETYALSILDGRKKEAGEVLDGVYSRVKDNGLTPKMAEGRGRCIDGYIGSSNIYTDLVERIIKSAEDVALIEQAAGLLQAKHTEASDE